jgi:hypothetical protein
MVRPADNDAFYTITLHRNVEMLETAHEFELVVTTLRAGCWTPTCADDKTTLPGRPPFMLHARCLSWYYRFCRLHNSARRLHIRKLLSALIPWILPASAGIGSNGLLWHDLHACDPIVCLLVESTLLLLGESYPILWRVHIRSSYCCCFLCRPIIKGLRLSPFDCRVAV